MKFCEKCGNQLMDESVVCPQCGCPVAGKYPTGGQNKMTKSQAKGIILIAAGIVVIIAFIVAVSMQL